MKNQKTIQAIIGYAFSNKKLLQQAFTRRSYSMENGGNDNEVLEFIGDKVLDLAVVYFLSNHYGRLNQDGYTTTRNEGVLTELKAALVETDSLASVADSLGLTQYLIRGKSDINNRAIPKSMKEDLIEAIIGAVALDSKWNLNKTFEVVNRMLEIDKIIGQNSDSENYVGKLQNYLAKNGYSEPKYSYEERSGLWVCFGEVKDYRAEMFGVGQTKKEARQEVARELFAWIKHCDGQENGENEFYQVIGEPNEENSLQQINQLVQIGLISKPKYEYSCDYDEDGNPIWECSCTIDEVSDFVFLNDKGFDNSKKAAQRSAAFSLLNHLVGNDD